MSDSDRYRRLPGHDVEEDLRGFRRHEEERGVDSQADQGAAQDEFDDVSRGINHIDRGDHNDRGDHDDHHDNPRGDPADSRLS